MRNELMSDEEFKDGMKIVISAGVAIGAVKIISDINSDKIDIDQCVQNIGNTIVPLILK